MREIVGNTIATPNPQPDWVQTDEKKADYIKNKPTLGALAAKDEVTKSDLSEEVQAALQTYEETDPTVPDWAKAETKPSYTADEVGALPITGGTLTGILRTSASTPLIIGNEGKIGMRAAPTDAVTGVNHVGQINISNAWWNTGEGEVQNQWGTQISGYNGKTGKYNELRVSHEGVQYNSEDGSVYQILHSGNKGAANGVAELDENGKVLSAQLPSYVDDVEEYNTQLSFPTTGEAGKIYIDTSTNITYRWSGTVYTPIGSDLALGENETTAYRGDRGKIAYDHSQTAHAPADAEKNESAFGKLKYSKNNTTNTISAMTPSDTLTLTGTNVQFSFGAKQLDISVADATQYTKGVVKLSDVATTTTNGFMSATDKANLDALVASAVTVLSGTTEPTADIGSDGDIYLVLEE